MTSAHDAIMAARVHLLTRYPFFGAVAIRLVLVPNAKIDTMATDGMRLYYNETFTLSLKFPHLVFVVCHEILHCILWHLERPMGKNKELFWMAADYATNDILITEKCGEMPTRVVIAGQPEERVGLYDPKFHGLSTEEIYVILDKRGVQPQKGIGDHLDIKGPSADQLEKTKCSCKFPDGTEVELDETPENIMEILRMTVLEAAAVTAGNVPAGLQRLIETLSEPQLKWTDILDRHLQSTRIFSSSFLKPSRKTMHAGIMLPGLIRLECLHAAIAFDCSGSINSRALNKFMSELLGILDTFQDYRIHLFCFDTAIYEYLEITPNNVDEVADYIPRGRGGTDFVCIFDFIADMMDIPDRLVVFTDGKPNGSWGDPHLIETLWVIYDNPQAKPPFGQATFMK